MMVMTGLQKTEAIGRLAMKTAQAICKSLPLDGDYDNIYTFKMSEENHENKHIKKPSNQRSMSF